MFSEKSEIISLLQDTTLFGSLDEEELLSLAGQFSTHQVTANTWLYKKGDPTHGFYIIKDGEASILNSMHDSSHEDLILIHGDFAGEEAIFTQSKRISDVRMKQDGTVLFLPNEAVIPLIEQYLDIQTKTSILMNSRKLSRRVKLPWITGDEYVQIITRKHPILLFGAISVPIILYCFFFLALYWLSRLIKFSPSTWLTLLLISSGVVFIWLIWNIANWANDYYIITNKRMVWVEKVAGFYDSRQEAPLSTLLTVGTKRTRLGRIFGYSDVIVRTYVGGIQFRRVKHAKEISEVVEAYSAKVKASNLAEEGAALQEALHRKLNFPIDDNLIPLQKQDLPDGVTRKIEHVREINFFEWLFSDFFKVRYEVGGTTIYRKHWFTLIKSTFIPFVVFALSVWLTGAVATYNLTIFSRKPALVFFILMLISSFLWLIYQYIDWRNDIFQLTKDQIIDIDRKPLGKESKRSAPLENILSIEYERLGIFGLIFNFGTVYISVGSTKLTFDHVYNPSEVQQDIFSRMGTRLEEKRRINAELERERVSEWFKVYHDKAELKRHTQEDQTRKIKRVNHDEKKQ